jgi:hypothetical protein
MVFDATFNNILVISWQSVLLVEETEGPGENHRTIASHWQTLSHNVVHHLILKKWITGMQFIIKLPVKHALKKGIENYLSPKSL